MRIVLGTNNVANILTGLKHGLEELGHTVTVVVKERSKYYSDDSFKTFYRKWDSKTYKSTFINKAKEKIEYSAQAKRLNKFLKASVHDTDLYVFVWSSFISDFSDYEFLRKNNKRIVTLFAGSEVRYSSAFAQEYSINIDKWEEGLKNDDLNEKMHFVRTAELYSDLILSVPDQSGLMLAPYDHFFLPINVNEYSFRSTQREIPHIIHAPTRTGAKGTEVFLEVIDKLKNEGLTFEFSFLQNLSHEQLISKLSDSDILLDELYFHGPGMMAAEAMACGCVVVTRKLQSNTDVFNPPVCDVNFQDLYIKLKSLITNKNERERLALEARRYVEEFNYSKVVASRILNKLDNNKRDYSPKFYLNDFVLPPNTFLSKNNCALTDQLLKKIGMDEPGVVANLKTRGLV